MGGQEVVRVTDGVDRAVTMRRCAGTASTLRVGVLLAAVACVALPARAQGPPQTDLAKALLFWLDLPSIVQSTALAPDVRQALDAYRSRSGEFAPSFDPIGMPSGPERSVQLKRGSLERTLYALFDVPGIAVLAMEYAREARISYEWEGLAEAPLGEAAGADAFLERRPASPIAPYLELFAGHRKICATGGMKGALPSIEEVRRIAAEAVAQLQRAKDGGHPLIRLVADEVLTSRRCFW
jgi:hypothetical protein